MDYIFADKRYTLDLSFAALLGFFIKHRRSIFDVLTNLDKPENAERVIRLLYDGAKINIAYDEFRVRLGADSEAFKDAYVTALKYARELTHIELKSNSNGKESDTGLKGVEITFFALAIISGLDTRALEIMTFSGVADAVMKISEIKGGKSGKKYRKAAGDEIAKMYPAGAGTVRAEGKNG